MRPKLAPPSRYVLAEALGAGGMGVVRLALDRRIGREIAVKKLRMGDRAARALERRFQREACVQALLEHPAIVPVYDIGRDDEGALYFSMKRVRGETLDVILERLRAGDAPNAADVAQLYTEGKLLTAFTSICHAVDFAHRHGVVHRDLKPANMMLGDHGEVYVIDWGVAALIDVPDPPWPAIARVLPADAAGAHTPAGELAGTPGYLSPEQARCEPVDGRADVYALGAVLFELLSLEPLHPRGTTATILVSTLRGPDARPSVRAPERNIAPELDAICVRATALEPADRFQSPSELLDALERYRDGHRRERPSLGEEPTPATTMPAEEDAAPRSRILRTARGALVAYAGWFAIPFVFWIGSRGLWLVGLLLVVAGAGACVDRREWGA